MLLKKKKREGARNIKGFLIWAVPLSIAFMLFGFLFTIQYNTQQSINTTLTDQTTNDLITLVQTLTEQRTKLEQELETLEEINTNLDLTTILQNEIEQLQIHGGSTEVTGEGVVITLTGDSPFVSYDLIDIINELFGSGAEAISINDTRITFTTSILDVTDSTNTKMITINGQRLLTPVVIKAIGDAETLETGLTFSGGIIDNLTTLYNITPTIQQKEEIIIPAVKSITDFQYMKIITE